MLRFVHSTPGRSAAVIVCDHCGEIIRDHKMAIAAYDLGLPYPKDEQRECWHLHKGDCHDNVEANYMENDRVLGWRELDHWLFDVMANSGMTLADLERGEAHSDFSQIM